MVDRLNKRPGEAEVLPGPTNGIRLTFVNPELLNAYTLNPERFSGIPTLAERMSGIREIRLGEFPLDGQLFESTRFTLVIEPDKNPDQSHIEFVRPTAIIRADLCLGKRYSKLTMVQAERVSNPGIVKSNNDQNSFDNPFEKIPFQGTEYISLVQWDRNLGFISPPLERETFFKIPVVVLQLWDKDMGVGSISLSLFSWMRFSAEFRERREGLWRDTSDGREIDYDEADRWQFKEQVGIEVYDLEAFKDGITFYERAFSKVLAAFYQAEGLTVPNLNLEIESPLVFKEDKAVTFEDIGGQHNAVQYLRGLAASERTNRMMGGRTVLLHGQPGNGKSSLVQAFASELVAPLIKKTTLDLPREATEVDVMNLLESGYLEAKSAAKVGRGKAVYCLEGIEAFLGQIGRLHDFLLNQMEIWENDPEVVLTATSNFPEMLHPGIISRFVNLDVPSLSAQGIKEILQIHVSKIAKLLGRDVFAGIDMDKVSARMATIKNFSGRDVMKFLSGTYSLSRVQSQPIDTDFLLSNLPDQRLGFRT